MRRFLIALAVAFSLAAPVAVAQPAAAFCDTSEGCSPCPMQVVIDGKNTRIESVNC